MKLSELLADGELLLKFFEGLNPDHEVRLAQQPGAVDVVVEPPKATEPVPTETPTTEQKEGE